MAIHLAIAEDHELVRAGLVQFLESSPDIEVTAEAASGDELLDKLHATQVDLVLLDLSMPGRSGINIISSIKSLYPDMPIMVLSAHYDAPTVSSAMRAGASGYLSKSCSPQTLLEAVHEVIVTGKYLSQDMADRVAHTAAQPDYDETEDLSSSVRLNGKTIKDWKNDCEAFHQLAFYDALTTLPNRRLLKDRLGQAMGASKRSGLYGAVMFIDLDNFKLLNDAYGHGMGDLLLVEVARRISHYVREVDTVARFGGDEFVVLLSGLNEDKSRSIAEAGIIAEKIRAILAEPYMLKIQHVDKTQTTVEHRCTSSIGILIFMDSEASVEDILKWADMAMYRAKELGRNQIQFHEHET